MLAFRRRVGEGVDIQKHFLIVSHLWMLHRQQTPSIISHYLHLERQKTDMVPGSTKLYFVKPRQVASPRNVTRELTKFEWLVSEDEK